MQAEVLFHLKALALERSVVGALALVARGAAIMEPRCDWGISLGHVLLSTFDLTRLATGCSPVQGAGVAGRKPAPGSCATRGRRRHTRIVAEPDQGFHPTSPSEPDQGLAAYFACHISNARHHQAALSQGGWQEDDEPKIR